MLLLSLLLLPLPEGGGGFTDMTVPILSYIHFTILDVSLKSGSYPAYPNVTLIFLQCVLKASL